MSDNYTNSAGGAGGIEPTMAISSVLDSLIAEFPDISISKIRFLESRGLIEPKRAPSGYRRFTERDVDQLRWILTMQRDHFLPLRVIKERLDAGEALDAPPTGGASSSGEAGATQPSPGSTSTAAVAGAPGPQVGGASSRFRAPGPDSENLDAQDVARIAGLTVDQLNELVKFGLVTPEAGENGTSFGRDELRVARAAGSFLSHGIGARHLKAWKVAAEREAGLLEQIVIPLSRQSSADATERAREVADDLINTGNTIREAFIVKALRRTLGSSAD